MFGINSVPFVTHNSVIIIIKGHSLRRDKSPVAWFKSATQRLHRNQGYLHQQRDRGGVAGAADKAVGVGRVGGRDWCGRQEDSVEGVCGREAAVRGREGGEGRVGGAPGIGHGDQRDLGKGRRGEGQ